MRWLKSYLRRRLFALATRHLDAAIAEARSRHGQVRRAQAEKSADLHRALWRGGRS